MKTSEEDHTVPDNTIFITGDAWSTMSTRTSRRIRFPWRREGPACFAAGQALLP
jgi:hypothetical protein